MLTVALVTTVAACTSTDIEYNYPRSGPGGLPTYEKQESVFGPGGLTLFSSGEEEQESGGGGGSGIPVNTYLWRASLDTVSFMPLTSADPFGGVIISDWYSPPGADSERFKVNIFILDRALRSDGVRATIFKQQLAANGVWREASQATDLGRRLEDAILTRARQLRIGNTAARN